MSPSRTAVVTEKAPEAIGPYSQAIASHGLLFISGQLPLDAAGEMRGEDPAGQARQCLENVAAVAAAAGASLADAVKLNIYTTEMGAFAEINEVYASFFEGAEPPARAAVGVAALPKGAQVEIEAVVALD